MQKRWSAKSLYAYYTTTIYIQYNVKYITVTCYLFTRIPRIYWAFLSNSKKMFTVTCVTLPVTLICIVFFCIFVENKKLITMPGGNCNIRPEDGVQFGKNNKAAEKWNEKEALKFGNDLLNWMLAADENVFFDDFIYLQDHTGKYAGEVYADLPVYLAKKFSSFYDILQKCRNIEKTKLKKFSAFDKLNSSIAKFLLSAEYGLTEKTAKEVTGKDGDPLIPKVSSIEIIRTNATT